MDLPPKHDVARALLLSGSVYVHLDPRVAGVEVPKWLKRQPQLVLQVGLDMAIPIPDLRVDERGIYGTLSFNRAPFTCQVPWEAIFALAGDDGRGMVWPESMPEEISAEIEREAGRRPPPPPSPEASGADRDEEITSRGGVLQLRPRRPAAAPPSAATPSPKALPPAAAPRDDGEGGTPPARPGAKSGKNLPPYLRVIK